MQSRKTAAACRVSRKLRSPFIFSVNNYPSQPLEQSMFNDKVVVVTGAGSGIGRELDLQFCEAGAQLAL